MSLFKIMYMARSLINVMSFIILVRVILSWMPMLGGGGNFLNSIMNFVYGITEPFLAPIRAVLAKTPLASLPIDLSPIVLFMLLSFLTELTYTVS